MNLVDIILDFLFPKRCLGCRRGGVYLCPACLEGIPPAEDPPDRHIISVFSYQNPIVRKAVWALKYKGRKDLAKTMARALYDRLLEELAELRMMEDFVKPILIPIPLSKKRLWKRGFNQSEIIARELIKMDTGGLLELAADVLLKIKDTKNQVEIKDRSKRISNLKGCFAVKNPGLIKNRNIIVLDDVTTTGATLKEARRVLKSAGTGKIIALTVAH